MITRRRRISCSATFVVALACTLGCRAELASELTVDGQPFYPNSCRSGQVNGFAGVDLIDDGRTLGCRAELASELQVDGQPFYPNSCRSGQVNGFAGVDLIDDGRTLRIVQTPTNQPQAILLDGQQVVDFGLCGTMSLERQGSTVNDITNVMGAATLKCEAAGHTVEGTVSFKNCH